MSNEFDVPPIDDSAFLPDLPDIDIDNDVPIPDLPDIDIDNDLPIPDLPDIDYNAPLIDSTPAALKVPPHSLEAEQAVLGGLMLNNDAWVNVADLLTEEDFYRREHQLIFKAIKNLSEEGKPADVITLAEWLDRLNKLKKIGGLLALDDMARNTPSAVNILAYADIVRKQSVLRQLGKVGNDIADMAFFPKDKNVEQLLDHAEKRIFEIAEQGSRQKKGFQDIKDVLTTTLEQIDFLYQKQDSITGIPTGYKDLDDLTSGLQPSDLIIIAGRPSMGKTTFSMNIAEYVAVEVKQPVAVFSMEMSAEQLVMRLLSSLSRINQQKVRTGKLEDDDWPRITTAVSQLSSVPLFIDDTPALSPTELRARARRLAREHGQLGLIVIDYVQLMQVPESRDNRTLEVSEISRSLKALAKELHVPVVALSQLNRSLEQRPDKRPKMSDLRESGCLAGDSLVLLADNQQIPIKNLEGQKDFTILGLNTETCHIEEAQVSRVFCSGIKMVFRLKTRLGRKIKATANHKFYTPSGWKRLDELNIDDDIAVPLNLINEMRLLNLNEQTKDIYWDKVISIQKIGQEKVFDLTVPTLHNFICNSIFVHNSLEQDADLVVFIYRDEVYHDDSPEKGSAEIIIAKQRNGPIGYVRLTFKGEITRFENYTEDFYQGESYE